MLKATGSVVWLPALAPCLMAIFLSLFLEVRPIPWMPIGLLAAWVVVGVGAGASAALVAEGALGVSSEYPKAYLLPGSCVEHGLVWWGGHR